MILESLLNISAEGDAGFSTLGSPAAWLFDSFGLVPSEAGVLVSERNATGLSAVWTCVNIRAGLMASLPLNLYSREANNRRKLADNRREYRILHDRPSPEDTSYTLRHKLAISILLWGNAYALIETDGRGQLRYLWPYHPTNVRLVYGKTRGDYHYIVTGQGPDGYVEKKVMPEDMIHLRGFSYEGLEGISVIQNYRRGLGMAIAREVFESNFVKNGAKVSGILQYPGRLGPEGRENLQSSFEKKHAGSANAGRVLLLEEGAKFIPTMMPMTDAQFIENKKLSRAEIAGLYRIPTMLLPGSDDKAPTYSSGEVFNRQLVDYVLRDDCTLWQDEFSSKLFPDGDHFCEFDLKDLLRGDTAARAEYWSKRWQMGSISANEIRADENENPIKGGDKYYVPVNYQATDEPPQPRPAAVPPVEPNEPPEPPTPKKKPGSAFFHVVLANLTNELKAWENFSSKRAAAKLRGLLVEPMAAELGCTNSELMSNLAADLSERIRTLEPAAIDSELDRLIGELSGIRIQEGA